MIYFSVHLVVVPGHRDCHYVVHHSLWECRKSFMRKHLWCLRGFWWPSRLANRRTHILTVGRSISVRLESQSGRRSSSLCSMFARVHGTGRLGWAIERACENCESERKVSLIIPFGELNKLITILFPKLSQISTIFPRSCHNQPNHPLFFFWRNLENFSLSNILQIDGKLMTQI